ncbi:hypothetical protein CC86DRAFT_404593 [Ophiobolus disseminans]|uniref:Rhodopsin domain-containing protein n=1 Tax=Ophiobolus disseminans TaxID=1469910 RepID=A0A6A7A699_9PLEO|nr:hypothetical protein CC86DRAFT_404593 [Ophiobolus disseminans]
MGTPAPPKQLSDLDPAVVAFSNAPALLAQTAPFFSLAALVVIGRCYVRVFMLRAFGKDDWTILLAMLMAVACFTCYIVEISCGVGKYTAVIRANPETYRTLLKARLIHQITVMTGISLVKISISFLLLRLAARKTYKWFLWGMIGFMGAFTLTCLGTLVSRDDNPAIFQCIPVAATWDMRLRAPPFGTGNAKCFSGPTFSRIGLMNAVVNITTDFMLAIVPIPLIWKLQLNIQARISLVAILSLGFFAAIAGIIKQTNATQFRDPEPYVKDAYTIWNFIELYVGIVAASLPALKPLFSWLHNTTRGLSKGTRGTGLGSTPVGGGYQKQTGSADIVLHDYKGGPSVRISSNPYDRSNTARDLGGAKGSEDSILSHDNRERVPNSIMVTRQVQVN